MTLIKDKVLQGMSLKEYIKSDEFVKFKKYLIVGFASFAIEYILFILITLVLDVHYITINIIVYIVIFILNYLLNRIWTFESKEPILKQLVLYGLLFLVNLIVANIFLMYMLTDLVLPAVLPNYVMLHKYIAKVLIMGAIVSWNFILYKLVIYK